MGAIFLSYAREDKAFAERLACVLEAAGHSVWWDRRIGGGEEFGAEIEAELDKSDVVLVAWSSESVKSRWVRDEAAVGGDRGILVPVTIDGSRPPMGFRQFHTLDLTGWRGGTRDAGTAELLQSVERRLKGKGKLPPPAEPAAMANRSFALGPWKRLWAIPAGLLLVLAAAVAATWLWRSTGVSDEPRFAISPTDGSVLSRQVAHDLAVTLPSLSTDKASAYELIDTKDASSANADLVLTAGASSSGGRERRDLSLRAPSNEAILWSASIDQPSAASANLPQQLAIQAQRALSCAAEALSYRRESIGRNTLKLYLSGCTIFDYALDTNVDYSDQVKLFEQVLAKAPHFEPAWAKLFALEIDAHWARTMGNPRSLAHKVSAQITEVEKLGLDFGELYAAKAASLAPSDFIGIFNAIDEGIERHPDSDVLYRLRGYLSVYVGRMSDSVDLTAHAVRLNPLSPANQEALASAYVYAGNAEAGFAQLRNAEQLWPGAPTIMSARGRLYLRYGDPKGALAFLQGQNQGDGGRQAEQVAFTRARIDPTPANIERAIAETRIIYEQYPDYIAPIVQTLAQFGRNDEVIDILLNYRGVSGWVVEVLFRPALRDIWRDPRSMAAAAHLGLLYYWKTSGNWPDFCFDPKLPYDCKNEAAKYPVQKFTVAPAKK